MTKDILEVNISVLNSVPILNYQSIMFAVKFLVQLENVTKFVKKNQHINEMKSRNLNIDTKSHVAFETGQLLQISMNESVVKLILDSNSQHPKYVIINNLAVCVDTINSINRFFFGSVTGLISTWSDFTNEFSVIAKHEGKVSFVCFSLFKNSYFISNKHFSILNYYDKKIYVYKEKLLHIYILLLE